MRNKIAEDILKKHLVIKIEEGKLSEDDRVDAILDAMEEYKIVCDLGKLDRLIQLQQDLNSALEKYNQNLKK
jgi:hypothetical protein